MSCLFGPGVDGGVTCLLAAPSVGGTPRRPLKGRAMVMPWSVQTEVEYTYEVVASLGNLRAPGDLGTGPAGAPFGLASKPGGASDGLAGDIEAEGPAVTLVIVNP